MIMNKKSQFTKIFSQGILEMKETGTVEIMYGKRVHQMEDNLPKPKEKSLGYKKLAFLFAALASGSGTIISLFVVFLENIAKLYLEKHQSTSTTIHTKQNSIDDRINKFWKTCQIVRLKKPFKEFFNSVSRDLIFDLDGNLKTFRTKKSLNSQYF